MGWWGRGRGINIRERPQGSCMPTFAFNSLSVVKETGEHEASQAGKRRVTVTFQRMEVAT